MVGSSSIRLFRYKKRRLRHTERHQGYAHKEKRLSIDTLRRQPCANQEEKPQKKPTLRHLDLGLLTSRAVRK